MQSAIDISTSTPAPWPCGIFPNVPAAEYHARDLGVASKSALDRVMRSPRHYLAWLREEEPDDDKASLIFGRALHVALLEPDIYRAAYVVRPDFGDCRFKANKARKDAWLAENQGRTEISAVDQADIFGIIRSIKAHPIASAMVRDGEAELTARWIDDETKLPCKARADYYVRELAMLVDVKTTGDASPEAFAKSCAKFGYARQDAFYRTGFAACDAPVDHFAFIACEKTPPYAIAVYQLDANAVERGWASVRRDMLTLADCVKRNEFPAYPETISTLRLPSWAT